MIDDLQFLFGVNDVFKTQVTEIKIDETQIANIKTPAKLEQEIMKLYKVKAGDLAIIQWKNLEDDILVSTDRTIFVSGRVSELI